MINRRWLVAIPIVMLASLNSAPARGSSVRDRAHMFSSDAVKKAEAQLERIERASHIPIVIETIDKVPGLDRNASAAERLEAINALAVRMDNALKDEGIYYLISKDDHLNSNVLVRERFASLFTTAKRDRIGHAFMAGFKKHDFDGGLIQGVQAIEQALERTPVGHKAAQAPGGLPVAARARGGSTMGTFLLIILGIFGVLLVLRLLGGLFGRSGGAGYPNQMGGMGMQRPGMGPGAPGYYGGGGGYGGGRGGGFLSGMLGGLGGAVAGNWLYDQFSGRHGNVNSADAVHSGDYASGGTDGGDAIVGADDNAGGGGSWDDGGTADTGGGDWGGGGGDWGGGGGDWGGGGGDWGGGGGGGDW
jgi:uncharacterized protein